MIDVRRFHLAKDKKFDVVLIDTAGRMQNDEPLMIALAKVQISLAFLFKLNSTRCLSLLVNSCQQSGFSFIRW